MHKYNELIKSDVTKEKIDKIATIYSDELEGEISCKHDPIFCSKDLVQDRMIKCE